MHVPNREELRCHLSQLEAEELRAIVAKGSSNYRQEAIDIATELLKRPITRKGVETITYSRGVKAENIFLWLWVLYVLGFLALPRLIQAPGFREDFARVVHDYSVMPLAILAALLILPLGISLHAVKRKNLLIYAYAEIAFGIVAGFYTIGERTGWGKVAAPTLSNVTTWTALFGSVYVVVRGLDNRAKAKDHRER